SATVPAPRASRRLQYLVGGNDSFGSGIFGWPAPGLETAFGPRYLPRFQSQQFVFLSAHRRAWRAPAGWIACAPLRRCGSVALPSGAGEAHAGGSDGDLLALYGRSLDLHTFLAL